ncbi:prephenate dehydrogenase [Actinocatenispora rupis]|uniref:Prephenate dehydrogenase n=1 Tax=Actinocatenispora rupis TaxID=519421 RepID=A0A8J3NEW7_9ACTN|nr:prephenate dehydrogenase/arogenate dehydrogenase family protein [Actinocatenispora rupis]GID14315.1 prephenate dehydrogenase [Actinocatenispora rupis]
MTLRTVTVIGLGLIGGSLLRALADRPDLTLHAYDSDPGTRALATTAGGHAWRVHESAGAAARDADLVVLAVPPHAIDGVLAGLADLPALVTDVCSVKSPVLDAARRYPVRFVGGHPMAGTERSGFAASDPALFADRTWVLCLEAGTDLADWLTVAALVTALGSRVVPTTADRHDAAVARVSHLTHLAASALAATAADPLSRTLGAGSFADGTRVAGSSPELWADICAANAGALRPALDAFADRLTAARSTLDGADPRPALAEWFTPGYASRTTWPPTPAGSRTVPATREALLALGAAGGWLTAVTAEPAPHLTGTEPAAGTE